jgi:glycosyltransferase involved in cell wall biosynthesis
MGNKSQFIPEMALVEETVKKLGLKWRVLPSTQWHDYSEVDAIVGVRQPSAKFRAVDLDPYRKPASKLFNAWLAGVPAVLSPDPSYQDYKRSEADYLAARNVREIVEQLKRLAGDPSLRHLMRCNGLERAKEISPDKIAELWIGIIKEQIVPEFHSWSASPTRRRWFSLARSLTYLH